MALQLGALHEAAEVAGYENRVGGIEAKLASLDARVTVLIAVVLAVVDSQFALWLKLGDIAALLAVLAAKVH